MKTMKTIFIFCLLAATLAMAQRQSVVVLPSIADPEAKLSPRQLEFLTDKVRGIIPGILPLKDFNLLKQDVVLERLGAEGLFAACKEGSCVGDLVARIQADFGTRCEVLVVENQLYLKFELYGTLRGERDAGTIEQFNEPVKNFNEMLALLDKKAPAAFKKIVTETASASTPTPAAGGSVVARIETEPAGAALKINGIPYQGCPKTPCTISLYENRFKLTASLDEHEASDTNLVITLPNQLVTVKLKPTTYLVNFASQPAGASLSFDGEPYPGCRQTPCSARFKKGTVKVTANLNMRETKDTTILVSQNNQRIDFNLLLNYGTLSVRPAYVRGIGKNEEWILYANGKQLPFYSNLAPGRYDLKLTHDCYEDVLASVDIEKGKLRSFDIAVSGMHPKPDVTFSVCSEAAVDDYREKPEVDFDYSEADKTMSGSLGIALALDIIGIVFLGIGIANDNDVENNYAEYSGVRQYGRQSDIDAAWQKVDDAKTTRNMAYVMGSLFLAAGIGVHIWF